jgi:ATP-dependent RNA helicase RhlE
MGFSTFGLSDHILQGVRAAGYTSPTPIQSLAIRPALVGKDIIASAQTGTGKTAAFVLPILHRLAGTPAERGNARHPRALVLTPTRELAQQIQDAVATYGRFLSLQAISIYGGVSMDKQMKLLRRGADIVVATPGRLLDHLQRNTIDLSKIQVLVLDEADRMLDMGFINDVRKIIGRVPKERQTLLFSATLSNDINRLAGSILHDPETLETGERHNPVETITQHFYDAPKDGKMDLLAHALNAETMQSVLVFSRTKHGADKISHRLERSGISSIAIHSNRTQSQRERALDGFKRGKYRVLVATDIAARGIDVSGISHVINFDVPQFAEDYIHRIGRTGRAGASGDAITFVSREEQQYLRRIEKFTGNRFPVKQYPGAPAMPGPRSKVHASDAASHKSHATGHTDKKRHGSYSQEDHGRRPGFMNNGKKKKSGQKREAFSGKTEGRGWSNH